MKLSKFVKNPLNVALRKTEVGNPLISRLILTLKKKGYDFVQNQM